MKILIIEDNHVLRKQLQKVLKEEGYFVQCASDGEKGSYLARINNFNLILLDMLLPNKNGFTVCQEIRNKKNTPIILISVKSDIPTKTQLFEIGIDDYLVKPFSYQELNARIKAVLRRSCRIEKNLLYLHNKTLKINLQNHKVIFKQKKITLTLKEYSILVLLAKNKGKIVTKSEIIEQIWDLEKDLFSNTIESHIRNIRHKLNPHDRKMIIKTVCGRGYLIE